MVSPFAEIFIVVVCLLCIWADLRAAMERDRMKEESDIINAARALGLVVEDDDPDALRKAREHIEAWQKRNPTKRVPFLSDPGDFIA